MLAGLLLLLGAENLSENVTGIFFFFFFMLLKCWRKFSPSLDKELGKKKTYSLFPGFLSTHGEVHEERV